jgi:hypothetical protein
MASGEGVRTAIDRLARLDLAGRVLCHAAIELAGEAPRWIGRTPWRHTRVSDIAGGRFAGERLSGDILASGADWADQGYYADGAAVSRLDVRSVWRTDDGVLINVTYPGRAVIPPQVLPDYQDVSRVEGIEPSSYYFRTTPLFETADARYEWLNGVVSVGLGRRTRSGVHYKIYEIL